MNDTSAIHEKFVFFSDRKEGDILSHFLETILFLPLENLAIEYSDRPDEEFSHFNERTRKILLTQISQGKLKRLFGEFSQGGSYELKGGSFSITMFPDQYNYEVVDSMRKILSPVFPMCIFKNPYIWGVDLYEDYTRECFFETRTFTVRSQHLEDPQIDIFRRDDGIIFKFRFHLHDDYRDFDMDEGVKFLHPLFNDLSECLKKRAYEGLEVLFQYCSNKGELRRFETRTKLGQKIKSMLKDR